MQNAIALNAPATLALPTGKNGKVSASVEKAGELLAAMDDKGFLSAVINGKGDVGKVARYNVAKSVDSVDSLIYSDSIDGGQWPTLLGLLVGEFGAACFNRATMKGKTGAREYMALVVKDREVKADKAETLKGSEAAEKKLARAHEVSANVERLATAYLNAPQ